VRLSRHYVPAWSSRAGAVIFLSSESGIAIPADMLNYGVTKSANLAVSHGWPTAGGHWVTVNAICRARP
jgi:NAD(P)-dependent dehydrogenase (short-subunit alcohol dehydrogenase family)